MRFHPISSGGLYNAAMLTIKDHRRDSAGLRYVYPVVSRRAGGVSVGINLNVNNACNWACLYCQVENLTRGGPPAIDLDLLEKELAGFLDDALNGDFMQRQVAETERRLVDVAFSGNGEPTSADEFPDAVRIVRRVLEQYGLTGKIPLRLITNGSLLHRQRVQEGIRLIGETPGEIWFKIDRASAAGIAEVNQVPGDADRVQRNLRLCCELTPTWVQTCWFAIDGEAPDLAERDAYCSLLAPLASELAGIHLYGLARPSLQPAAPRLSRIADQELKNFAQEVEKKTGIRVVVSP
jgi:wyosine [tRNA(Phe)-imidazoG37] synthetase (radical SAM superfamily)